MDAKSPLRGSLLRANLQLEFTFASTRHIEIFEIECRKAKGNGHQKAI